MPYRSADATCEEVTMQARTTHTLAGLTTVLACSILVLATVLGRTPGSSVAIGNAQDASGLHVAGRTLRNAAGQVVPLRGVNRSSWEYHCFDGSGQTHDGTADQTEVSAMLAWNV